MKTLATVLLLVVGFTAVAQRTSYHQEIDDDGRKLKIRVDRVENGRTLHYSNTFNVSGMSQEEKDELIARTLESVKSEHKKHQVARVQQAPAPASWAVAYDEPREPQESAPSETVVATSAVESVKGATSFQKSVEEDAGAGRIKIRYEYLENGEEHIFERTINTEGRTEKDIRKLIEETEQELGFSAKSV